MEAAWAVGQLGEHLPFVKSPGDGGGGSEAVSPLWTRDPIEVWLTALNHL